MSIRRFIPTNKYNAYELGIEQFKKTELSNGIRIISEEVPSVDSFALGISVGSGSAKDTELLAGRAHCLEHAVFRRTVNKTTRQIASTFESVGAFTNAYTTKEQTCFYVRALKSHFVKTFNLLAELVLNPVIIKKELETEKLIIIEEIKSYEDDPEELICDAAEAQIFKGHPYGLPIAGTIDTVSRISVDNLKDFHTKEYVASNIIIASAGNLSHERLVARAEKMMESLAFNQNEDLESIKPPSDLSKDIVSNEERKPFTQAHLLLARQVPGLRSDDRYPLAVLNVLLGDGMSSRLYQQIREMRGLAYSIDSSLQMLAEAGVFYIYAALEEKNTTKALKLIEKELKKVIDYKLSSAEIYRAKQQLTSELVMSMESMSTRMQSMIKSEFIHGRQENIAEKISAVQNLSYKSIKDCAEKYLDINCWSRFLYLPE